MIDLLLPDGRVITRWDADVVRSQADLIRKYSADGWTKGRTMRHIGAIPLSEFQKLEMETVGMTDAERSRHLKRYLNDNSQFRTVPPLNTAKAGAL